MKIIDTHSHLYLSEFDFDRIELIKRAKEKGITSILLPNIDATTITPLFKLCDDEPKFAYPMLGLHPTSVNKTYSTQLSYLEKLLTNRDYCAIGEIGIDLYWETSHLEEQKKVFEEQLYWAKGMNLPVSIHVRDAFFEVINIIHKVGIQGLKGVFHCFSGSETDLLEIKRLNNFKIGINGVVTFKKSNLPELLKIVPLQMIVLETDAPYLAPVPFRGKRNEPEFIWETIKKIAHIYDIDTSTLLNCFYKNTLDIFGVLSK